MMWSLNIQRTQFIHVAPSSKKKSYIYVFGTLLFTLSHVKEKIKIYSCMALIIIKTTKKNNICICIQRHRGCVFELISSITSCHSTYWNIALEKWVDFRRGHFWQDYLKMNVYSSNILFYAWRGSIRCLGFKDHFENFFF